MLRVQNGVLLASGAQLSDERPPRCLGQHRQLRAFLAWGELEAVILGKDTAALQQVGEAAALGDGAVA